MTLRERFEAKYVVNEHTGCWEWTATGNELGYGFFTVHGKNCLAHRASYELLVGPIPDGLILDHLCRNPPCVNPAHLEPVTQHENILRGNAPAAVNARKTHCLRDHEFTPENTAVDRRGRRQCRECRRVMSRRKYHANKKLSVLTDEGAT